MISLIILYLIIILLLILLTNEAIESHPMYCPAVHRHAAIEALSKRAVRATCSNVKSTDSEALPIKKLLCLILTLVCCMTGTALSARPSIAQAQEQQTSPEEVAGWFEQHLHLGLADIAWGDLHNHTYYSQDAYLRALRPGAPQEVNPGTAYEAAIDKGLDFHAVADHAEAPVISQIANGAPNVWESTKQYAAYYDAIDDKGRSVFTPFVGYEYTNPFPCVDRDPNDGIDECTGERYSFGGNESYEAYGHKNVVFRSISATPNSRVSFLDPALWTVPLTDCAGDTPNNYCGFDGYTVFADSAKALWQRLREQGMGPKGPGQPGDVVTIIHSPGNIHHNDWNATDPDFVRNIEIFSQWGNAEGPQSCSGTSDLDVALISEALNDRSDLIRPQLEKRWLQDGDADYTYSFVGGSDDHAGSPGGGGNGNGGVTGLITRDRTRDGLFDALWNKHTLAAVYYSQQAPMAVLMSVETGSQRLIGGDVGTVGGNGEAIVRVLADHKVQEVQLVVDGCTLGTYQGTAHVLKLSHLDTAQRHYIYVRARTPTGGTARIRRQADFNQTWSSPVYLRNSVGN